MRRWCIAIFVAVFSFYLLTSSREPAWGDAHPMWDVADAIVHHGKIDIPTRWPEDIPPGRGGKIYGIAPIGPALVQLPGAVVVGLVQGVAPSHVVLFKPVAVHLAPAALGALACVLFFLLLVDLGRTPRTASACTAILAVATTTWVYARYPYSEILQLACFLGMFRATWRVIAAPTRREALWLGAWAGCLLDAKYIYALAIGGAIVAIAWSLRTRRAELRRVLAWAAVAGAPFVVLALAYNYLRWGSVFETGYGPYLDAFFGGSLGDGAWGMLLSPNKSALLYSPPLVLAIAGAIPALRERPRLGLLLATIALPTFLVCCTYRSWSGDYAWGPRFFVYAVPVALVPIAWFVDRLTRAKKLVLVAAIAAGIGVQLLGNALYWDHFIRVAIDTKNQWLGNPNRTGAYVAEAGRGHCDSCFEDTYEVLWTPAFQPIRGHWWLVKSLARGDDWHTAQADAPWRRYTSLDVDLSRSYPRARIDWWGLLWLEDAPSTWPWGLALLMLFAVGTGAGGAWWLRLHRRAGHATGIVRSTGDAEGSARPEV
jgi:hypothetical protein